MSTYNNLNNLKINDDGTFNLGSNPFYLLRNDLNFIPRIVRREEELKPGLICYNIWQDETKVPELLKINNIVNPFSIRAGMIIYFVPKYQIENYYELLNNDPSQITSINRSIAENRTRIINTIEENNNSSFGAVVVGNKILLI